jgi:hypothetical protein
MPSAIAFFPWVQIDRPLTVGAVRLLPYVRGRLPGDGARYRQADIDKVLSAYALRRNQEVQKATMLEYGNWHLGEDFTHRRAKALFRARELVAFSALANRQLFRRFRYCNFDNYALTVQRYASGHAEAFSFSTRRRDGGTQNLWDTDEFAFLKPLHVDSETPVTFETPLLRSLLAAVRRDAALLNAVVEFNRANTDSQDVPTHTEVVMTKSAFEFLLGIGEKSVEFVRALNRIAPPKIKASGPLANKWKARFPMAARPLEAWAREFCDLRGGAAHGGKRGGQRFVWPEEAHLAFASILFPLLVKHTLAQQDLMTLDEGDSIHLEYVEEYLMYNPFGVRRRGQASREHPWSRVYTEQIAAEKLRRGLEKTIQAIDWSKTH